MILLITDGEEGKSGDFVKVARRASEMEGLSCKIFILGIAQDAIAQSKAKQIANGGYYNIKSESYIKGEFRSILSNLKLEMFSNSRENIIASQNKNLNIQEAFTDDDLGGQMPSALDHIENKMEKFVLEKKIIASELFDDLEEVVKSQSNYPDLILSQISLLKEKLRIQTLLDSGLDSTTLTIDSDYSERLRQISERFVFDQLIDKYSLTRVNWLNSEGESYASHDFEVLNEKGDIISIVDCKGTPNLKPTFYLTSREWIHFLKNRDIYQVYRVFNVQGEIYSVCIENLHTALLNGIVVPYLNKPEILNAQRVYLTLTGI